MHEELPEGIAIVWCDGAFATPNGKTANGLVRFTQRYEVFSIVDATCSGRDAGEVLDGRPNGILVHDSLESARAAAKAAGKTITHFVVGLAPDGGRLPASARTAVADAIAAGLHVDSGLHDYLSDDPSLSELARANGVQIRDVRKPLGVEQLHFFTGNIEKVESHRIALLGTDSAVGKRTTAWMLVHTLQKRSHTVELIGTGQTAWLQGVRFGIVLDSIVNDFVSGEIEHAIWRAWTECAPDFLVLEGQGSLMNPAYPGGFELLAAGRPHAVVLQHAPARRDYDGFPGYPIQPLEHQIRAIETVSGVPVIAICVNHEGLEGDAIARACDDIEEQISLPAIAPLTQGVDRLAQIVVENRAAHPRVAS